MFSKSIWVGSLVCILSAWRLAAGERTWNVSDGYLNDPASWSDGLLPGPGDTARFSGTTDCTVRIPAGGFTETSGVFTLIKGIDYGHTLVFDATGTSWFKPAGTLISNWQVFMIGTVGDRTWPHLLNVTGATPSSPIMELSGGRLIFKRETTGFTLELARGATWNFYNPGGITVDANQKLVLHDADYAGAGNRVVFRDGSKLIANTVWVTAGPKNSLVLFEGGDHEIKNGLTLGVNSSPSNNGAEVSPFVQLDGGTLAVSGDVVVGGRAGSAARLRVQGSAALLDAGLLNLSGASGVVNATGIVEVADQALVTATDVTLGNSEGATSILTLSGRSRLNATGLYIGRRTQTTAELTVRDEATLNVDGSLRFYLSGSGQYAAREVRFTQEGGTINAPMHYLGVSGTNVTAVFSGGASVFNDWQISGDVCTFATNRVMVSGGVHTMNNIVQNKRDASTYFEISGGTLSAAGNMKLGEVSGTHQFRMSGGELKLTGTSGLVLGATADAVLTGGRLSARYVTGTAGGHILADGVTIAAFSESTLFKGVGVFELGSSGMTVEVGRGLSGVKTEQAYTDAPGTDGLFTKTGDGVMEVRASSTHAQTTVAGGTLTFGLAEGSFGRTVTVTNNAVLAVSASDGVLTCGRLTLGGTDGSYGMLSLAPGARVSITEPGGLSVNHTELVLEDPSAVGASEVLVCVDDVTAAQAAAFSVMNPAVDREYVFSADGNVLRLTVTAITSSTAVWAGMRGTDWNESANWGDGSVPSATASVIFPKEAASKAVTVPASGVAMRGLSFSDAYTLSGGPLALIGKVSVASGAVRVGAPLVLSGAVTFDTAAGALLSQEGPLSSVYGTFTKTGAGRLTLNGSLAACAGSWTLSGGVLEAGSADGLGAAPGTDGNVTLESGTLCFPAGSETTVRHPVVISTGSKGGRVILSADRDVLIREGLTSLNGGLVKTGPGAVTTFFGEGTYAIGTGNDNTQDAGITSLPADGSSPAAVSAPAGLDVLDGRIIVKGVGVGRTIVNQTQSTWIGTAWTGGVAQASLILDGVTYNQGGAVRPLTIGSNIRSGSPSEPSLVVKNSAVAANTLVVGSGSTAMHPVLAVTNGTVSLVYELTVGDKSSDNPAPEIRLGQGAEVQIWRADGGSSTGINLRRNVNGFVSDGAVLRARSNGNGSNIGVQFDSAAWGTLRFSAGGTLSTYKFMTKNNTANAEKHVSLIFDGGVLEMTKSGETVFTVPEYQGFTVEGAGMEVRIPEGQTNLFACPFRGAGQVVKTGGGRLVFVSGRELAADNSVGASGYATGACTGGLEIREGVFETEAGALRTDTALIVADGAVLDLGGGETPVVIGALSGAGTVMNGTLAGALAVNVTADDSESANDTPRLADDVTVVSAGFKVAFTVAEGIDLRGALYPVCRVADGAVFDCAYWKPSGLPSGLTAVFTRRDGVVWAQVKSSSGLTVLLR